MSVPALWAVEEARRVVLDAQGIPSVDRCVADEGIFALFEPEAEKVRGRDELGLPRLADDGVDVLGRALVLRSLTCRFASLGLTQVLVFGLPTIRLGDRAAVHLQWAPDEEAIADEPGVVAALAPDRRAAWAGQLNLLVLVEHVLLQLLPV